MDNDDLYQRLVILLKLFKNRPYHLSKYLLDNSAFNKNFLKKISQSKKISELFDDEEYISEIIYFNNISEMSRFYDSIIDDYIDENLSEDITKSLNDELDNLIKQEKFEEAAKIRDYMSKLSIKRINKN
jgi:hypothetical protein